MQPFDLERPQPSLVAWSRQARPVRFETRCDDEPFARIGADRHDAFPDRLDDLLFGFSTATLGFASLLLAVTAFVA